MKIISVFVLLLSLLVLPSSCDKNRVIDEYTPIESAAWSYENKLRYDIEITDTTQFCNLYLNVRNLGSYKYSNLFVLVTIKTPSGSENRDRINLLLADKTGEWEGAGFGDIFDLQTQILERFKFTELGTYQISLEQNMRDNPLKGISEAGIRIETID